MKINYNCPICGKCCSNKDEFVVDKSTPKIKQYFHKLCFDELLNRKKGGLKYYGFNEETKE